MEDEAAARRLLGVKGDALAAARSANRSTVGGPVLPALERYTGVLYDHLGAATLDAAARGRLAEEVLVLSGRWGVVRAGDLLPAYKLKMDATLPPLGRVSRWWRPHVTAVLDEVLAGALVWDLLPGAHAAAWASPDAAPALRVTAAFARVARRDGAEVRTAVTHWSKALKGALARHVLSSPPVAATEEDVRALLAGFDHDGYRLASLEGTGAHRHATFLAPAAA
jgi:uncharacterized protein